MMAVQVGGFLQVMSEIVEDIGEDSLRSLSNEIIGYSGNAFDPLLERHLSQRVVVEVTRDGQRRDYCG